MEPKDTKLIFVTGGVVSSLGKGLTTASIGALLEGYGIKIGMLKIDPYLNIDPGTMNPCQHGEVYVLEDGSETDLDFGHYERFTQAQLRYENSCTSGKIYETILRKERNGDYLGQTVQIIPHVTDEIKRRIFVAAQGVDILITEIGGVVGDIEGMPYLEALRQIAYERGYRNVLFIHLALLPFLKAAQELKSKPVQQSVAKLREIGIQPNILICRTEVPLEKGIRDKISLFCNVEKNAVLEERDVTTSIYEVPTSFHKSQLDTLIFNHFNLSYARKPLTLWENVMERIKHPMHKVTIGIIGKYTEIQDAYKSVIEALRHGGIEHFCQTEIKMIDSEQLESDNACTPLKDLDGILVPGGFGSRGIDGKISAIRYARENKIPFLGICLGMQLALVEFARNVLGHADANSTEMNAKSSYPVICLLEQQKQVVSKGATMRLGAQKCEIMPNSRVYEAYKQSNISERHRHRYEFNECYRPDFEAKGMHFVGYNAQSKCVEAIELPDHPWFVGVQFHPEFKSKPYQAHPLFAHFIKAAINNKH